MATAALLVALVLVVFRPTPTNVADRMPHNPGDPAFVTWTMAWGAHSLTNAPLDYFDANIFWPHDDTAVYSDTLLPLVPVYAVLHGLTGDWLLTLNVIVMGLVLLNLCATYGLARWTGVSRGPAVLAAVAFGFSGFVFAQYAHVQLQTLGLFPLAFLLLFRLLESPRLPGALALGVVSAALFLSTGYYGMVWAVSALTVVVGWAVVRRHDLGVARARALLVGGGLALLLALPVLLAYARLQEDPHFRYGLQPTGGINPGDLLSAAPGSYLYGALDDGDLEHRFFPGFVTYALAPVGVLAVARGAGHRRRVFVGLLVCAGGVALVLAVGDTLAGGSTPFRFLRDHLPGFASVRIAARFAVVTLLAGALAAAWGLDLVLRRVTRPGLRRAVAVAVPALLFVELLAPLQHFDFDDRASTLAVYHELDGRPSGVVLELPMADPALVGAAFVEAPRDLYSTIDWNERVNGYSGFTPPGHADTVEAANDLPAARGWRLLERMQVRYLLLHVGRRNDGYVMNRTWAAEVLRALPPGASASRHGASWLVEVDDPSAWRGGDPS